MKSNEQILDETEIIERLNSTLSRASRLFDKFERECARCDIMMKELRGLIAQVRGNAAKNDWYKHEIDSTPSVKKKQDNLMITTTQLDDEENAIVF